jgi:hypothetical protein
VLRQAAGKRNHRINNSVTRSDPKGSHDITHTRCPFPLSLIQAGGALEGAPRIEAAERPLFDPARGCSDGYRRPGSA